MSSGARERIRRVEAVYDLLIEANLVADGEEFRICGWGSQDSQRARFAALLRSIQFRGGSVVDFGCGTGGLFSFISEQGFDFTYVGVDMNRRMVDFARKRHCADFRLIEPDSTDFPVVDYVFASGVFQFADKDDPLYYVRLTRELVSRCRIGAAVNFLSALRAESEKTSDELYLHPLEVADLGASLSSRWVLDHSYHPGQGDMTLGIVVRANSATPWRRPEVQV